MRIAETHVGKRDVVVLAAFGTGEGHDAQGGEVKREHVDVVDVDAAFQRAVHCGGAAELACAHHHGLRCVVGTHTHRNFLKHRAFGIHSQRESVGQTVHVDILVESNIGTTGIGNSELQGAAAVAVRRNAHVAADTAAGYAPAVVAEIRLYGYHRRVRYLYHRRNAYFQLATTANDGCGAVGMSGYGAVGIHGGYGRIVAAPLECGICQWHVAERCSGKKFHGCGAHVVDQHCAATHCHLADFLHVDWHCRGHISQACGKREATGGCGHHCGTADGRHAGRSLESAAFHSGADELAGSVVAIHDGGICTQQRQSARMVGKTYRCHLAVGSGVEGYEEGVAHGTFGAVARTVNDACMGSPHGSGAATVHIQSVVAPESGHQVGRLEIAQTRGCSLSAVDSGHHQPGAVLRISCQRAGILRAGSVDPAYGLGCHRSLVEDAHIAADHVGDVGLDASECRKAENYLQFHHIAGGQAVDETVGIVLATGNNDAVGGNGHVAGSAPLAFDDEFRGGVDFPLRTRRHAQGNLAAAGRSARGCAVIGVVHHHLVVAPGVIHRLGFRLATAVVVEHLVCEVGGVDPHAFGTDYERILAAYDVNHVGGRNLSVDHAAHVGIAQDGVSELVVAGERCRYEKVAVDTGHILAAVGGFPGAHRADCLGIKAHVVADNHPGGHRGAVAGVGAVDGDREHLHTAVAGGKLQMCVGCSRSHIVVLQCVGAESCALQIHCARSGSTEGKPKGEKR